VRVLALAATQAELWDCGGGQNQTFTHTKRDELVV
jgi:hypothetical protein